MKFSIILATASDKSSIDELLASIASQRSATASNCEVIVVDQSFGEAVFKRVSHWADQLEMKYVHSLVRGLSISRNIGLEIAEGDVVCFADDDCTYEPYLIAKVGALFAEDDYDFVGVGVRDPVTRNLTSYTRRPSPHHMTVLSIEGRVTSVSLFVRRTVRTADVRFDQRLGLGAEFGSCEDLLFVRDLLRTGAIGMYQPSLTVFHEQNQGYSAAKTEQYAAGHGALTRLLFGSDSILEWLWAARKVARAFARWPMELFVSRKLYPLRYSRGFAFGFLRVNSVFCRIRGEER